MPKRKIKINNPEAAAEAEALSAAPKAKKRKSAARAEKSKTAAVLGKKNKKTGIEITSGRIEENKNIISEAWPAGLAHEFPRRHELSEQKKKLIMRAGISGLMIIFFIIWVFSLKYEFNLSARKSANSNLNWSRIKTELNQAVDQAKAGINQIKLIKQNSPAIFSKETALTPEQANLLKGKLLDEIAAGTTSSTKK